MEDFTAKMLPFLVYPAYKRVAELTDQKKECPLQNVIIQVVNRRLPLGLAIFGVLHASIIGRRLWGSHKETTKMQNQS